MRSSFHTSSILSLLTTLPHIINAQSSPQITVKNGTLSGTSCSNSGASAFYSIPYALPPTGSLRFAATQPWDRKFNGTYDASKQPASCMQFGQQFVEDGPMSEDWYVSCFSEPD
jgi:carboxylesterase type B